MARFSDLLKQAQVNPGPQAWMDVARLRRLGRQLTAQDVDEIVAEIARMTEEKYALPAWNGDDADDIAQYQEHLSKLLSGSKGAARMALRRPRPELDELSAYYVQAALTEPRSWWQRLKSWMTG